MYIVYIEHKKHSIWNTSREAELQRVILINHGHDKRLLGTEYIETNNYKNGHYFV